MILFTFFFPWTAVGRQAPRTMLQTLSCGLRARVEISGSIYITNSQRDSGYRSLSRCSLRSVRAGAQCKWYISTFIFENATNIHSVHIYVLPYVVVYFQKAKMPSVFFIWLTPFGPPGNLQEMPLRHASVAPWASPVAALTILCVLLSVCIPHQVVWEERRCLLASPYQVSVSIC